MRGKIKIIGSLLLICLFILCFSTISNAAIEIKAGTTRHTNIDISTAYQYCYDMRSATSTLGINSLDPHLSLNADWGATAYLGASTYGGVRSASGPTVKVNGANNFSTTNNITGVINLGATNSFVSATKGSATYNHLKGINSHIGTKYVEKLEIPYTVENTRGMALAEIKGWYSITPATVSDGQPLLTRSKVFATLYNNGAVNPNVTYRPVIWN